MKLKLFLLLTVLSLNITIAQKFVDNGIKYNITSKTTVEVIANSSVYSGAIIIPATVTNSNSEYNVTSIGYRAFFINTGLTSINIPNSVTSIGVDAFSECKALTSVTFGNSVKDIGDYAFYECIGLTNITIPNSVTSIGYASFFYCSGLTTVAIGKSVTSISNFAFYKCTNLTNVSVAVTNPASIILGGSVFFDVPFSTATLTVPLGSQTAYRAAEQWEAFGKSIIGDATLSTRKQV